MLNKLFWKGFVTIVITLLLMINFISYTSGNEDMSISSLIKSQDTIDIIIDYEDTNGIIKPFSFQNLAAPE